jgi:hypothetical protein
MTRNAFQVLLGFFVVGDECFFVAAGVEYLLAVSVGAEQRIKSEW